MKLREDQERLQGLLKETLTLLCKNGLQFDKGFCIDALIGITTDDKDVFLVNIKETIKNPGAVFSDEEAESAKQRQSDSSEDEYEKPRSARKRPPDDSGGTGISPIKRSRSNHNDDDDDASNFSSVNASEHDSAMNIKSEPHDDDELVFVKQELSDNDQGQNPNMHHPYPIGSFSGAQQHHNLNQSLPANYSSSGFTNNMNSPNTSMDGSAMNETWSQPPSGNLDPSQLANVSMTSQSTSQGGSQQSLVCQFCCRVYRRKRDLRYHMRGKHNWGEPLSCDRCGETFTNATLRRKHKQKCIGLDGDNANDMTKVLGTKHLRNNNNEDEDGIVLLT